MVKRNWRLALAALGLVTAVMVGITAAQQQQEPVGQTAFCSPVIEGDGVVGPMTTDGGTKIRVIYKCRIWTASPSPTTLVHTVEVYFDVGLPEARRNTAIGDTLAALFSTPRKSIFFTPFMSAE